MRIPSRLSGDEAGCLAVLSLIALLAIVGAGTVAWWLHWLWSSYSLVRVS